MRMTCSLLLKARHASARAPAAATATAAAATGRPTGSSGVHHWRGSSNSTACSFSRNSSSSSSSSGEYTFSRGSSRNSSSRKAPRRQPPPPGTADGDWEHSSVLDGRRQQQQQQQQQQQPWAQYSLRYLVTSHPGLEQVTADELQRICQASSLDAGVQVAAPGRVLLGSDSPAAGYAAAVGLRSATRVLQLLHEEALDPTQPAGQTVYDATRAAADWAELLAPNTTLGVHCLHFYGNSNITNSQLVQRRVRDAVCDAVRDSRGVRPAPPQGAPDLPLAFQMLSDSLQLFRDLGGGSLHRRGYRLGAAVHKAALNEAAAAGLLLLADWQTACRQEGAALVDPMCGSGTLLIEAALIATDTAPGLLRNPAENPWPFQRWHDYDAAAWKDVVAAAKQRRADGTAAWQRSGGRLLGNDCHAGALKLSAQAVQAAGLKGRLAPRLHQGLCGEWELTQQQQQPGLPRLLVATNPPWGKRLAGYGSQQAASRWDDYGADGAEEEGGTDLVDTWQQLGFFLRQQCAGADAWVLLGGDPEVARELRMRSSRKRVLRIGGVRTTWAKYDVYGGGRRDDRGDGGSDDAA